MSIRVYTVAEIIEGKVIYRSNPKFRVGDVAATLVNLTPVDNPLPGCIWTIKIPVGIRVITIELPPMIPKYLLSDVPLLLTDVARVVYFRDRLFMPERVPVTALEREEVILRVKKATYDEEMELASLRAAVANIEAASEFQKSGPKRDPISEGVKLLVWARDGGRCVHCGSQQELHFDHIIPVAKGGGNAAENVQILFQTCNLRKSDKIALSRTTPE